MTGHWVYFFSGVAVGCTLVLLIISTTTAKGSSQAEKAIQPQNEPVRETCEESDDWWKRGESPPWEVDNYFEDD